MMNSLHSLKKKNKKLLGLICVDKHIICREEKLCMTFRQQ